MYQAIGNPPSRNEGNFAVCVQPSRKECQGPNCVTFYLELPCIFLPKATGPELAGEA